MTITHPIFWICLISLIFWSVYERWDAHRKEYVDHPKMTTFYFLFSSALLIFVQPHVLDFFAIRFFPIVTVLISLVVTYLSYKILKFFFLGPSKTFEATHHYYLLLDSHYVLPKLTEIIYQQTFFGAIMTVFINDNISPANIFAICAGMFVVAHIPLFILQGKRIGAFYMAWAVLGAPLFAYVLLRTGSLWYTISLHMLFYTFLSIMAWGRSSPRYPWLFGESE